MPQRRILLLVTDLEIGGTPTVVRELARRLHRPPEVYIEVCSLKPAGPVGEQIKSLGISVSSLSMSRGMHLWGAVRQLRSIAQDRNFDTVVSFLMHANVVAAMAGRGLEGVRFFQAIQTTQRWPKWHWLLQSIAQASARMIVVPSTAVARAAEERCRVDPSRISIIPNAIDPADFPWVAVFSDPSKIRVGFIGRLDRVKGLPDLVLAMARLADRPEIELHIFGYGPEERTIQRITSAYKLENRVHLRGPVATPAEALAQLDIVVLPSPFEGFGLVLIEAMASGIPVIASWEGGAADVVIDGVTGLSVGKDNYAPEIADAIRRISDDAPLRNRLIENGLQAVQRKFTWDAVLPGYRRLLGISASDPR